MARSGKTTNLFAVWVSVAVVVVLVGIGGLVWWMNASATAPGEAPQASNINAETGAIIVGDGPDELGTYIDFMCPICNQFEQTYGESIQKSVDDGDITLAIHPIAILDSRSQGTAFSTRAANALYCTAVSSPDAVVPFMTAMYASQPAEGTPGLTDEEILAIASDAGASGIDSCVTDQRYAKYVGDMTEKTPVQPGNNGPATPTVTVNGEVISNSTLPAPDDLLSLFG